MFFLLQCHPLFLTKHDNDTAWNVFQKCFVHHNNSLQENVLVLQACFRSITRFFSVYQWLVGYWSYFNFWRFTQVCSVKISSGLGLFPYMYLGRWCTLKGLLPNEVSIVSHIRMTFPPFCRFSLPFWVTSFTTAVSYLCSGNYRTETQMRQQKAPINSVTWVTNVPTITHATSAIKELL